MCSVSDCTSSKCVHVNSLFTSTAHLLTIHSKKASYVFCNKSSLVSIFSDCEADGNEIFQSQRFTTHWTSHGLILVTATGHFPSQINTFMSANTPHYIWPSVDSSECYVLIWPNNIYL